MSYAPRVTLEEASALVDAMRVRNVRAFSLGDLSVTFFESETAPDADDHQHKTSTPAVAKRSARPGLKPVLGGDDRST